MHRGKNIFYKNRRIFGKHVQNFHQRDTYREGVTYFDRAIATRIERNPHAHGK
jgi:hypothetical protein